MKGASFAGFAVHSDLPIHHLNKSFADGQSQSRAAVFAGGGSVGLGKCLKQFGGLFCRHADAGVTYGKAQSCLVFGFVHQFRRHHYFPVVGELNGVVGEIEQYLAQTQRVAHQGLGDIRGRVEKNFQVLFPGFDRYQIGQVFQNIFQVKLDGFNVELSGFNFGKIQDIVDDPE